MYQNRKSLSKIYIQSEHKTPGISYKFMDGVEEFTIKADREIVISMHERTQE